MNRKEVCRFKCKITNTLSIWFSDGTVERYGRNGQISVDRSRQRQHQCAARITEEMVEEYKRKFGGK